MYIPHNYIRVASYAGLHNTDNPRLVNPPDPVGDIGPNHYVQYSLYQQGTFAPDDGIHRWMGSIAMDKFGNLGLGYSIAKETV